MKHSFFFSFSLLVAACGGLVEPFDASEESDAASDVLPDAPAACEAGTMECVGPFQPCGRRARTCLPDGSWTLWTCAPCAP